MLRRLLVLGCVLAGCRHGDGGDAPAGSGTSLAASAPAPESASVTVVDFLTSPDCTFGHRGILLDLADRTMRARVSAGRLARPTVEVREHEGASWAAVRDKSLELTFVSPSEIRSEAGVVVEARMRGGVAKSATVYLDGKPIGVLSLTHGETAIVATHPAPVTVPRGTNELLLRFNGAGRGTHDELAEVDWVRVGAFDGDAPYAAPTRSDVIATATIGGAAKRAVSLRAPGFARCSGYVPSGAMLEGFIGGVGGEADAEVRVHVDRSEPRVVASIHVGGPADPAGWRPIAIPLGDVGTLASVELVAKTSTKGTRVVFAEPRISAPAPKPVRPPPAVRGVVVVALGSIARSRISAYGGNVSTPEIADVGASGALFLAHRAASSFANADLAAMITGQSPRALGMLDGDTPLDANVVTIAQAARQGGVATAMFTANPTTSAQFGFARGWETFVEHAPTEDAPASAVFDDLMRWLDTHKDDRFLAVVHARGGHPPWDVSANDVKDMPPAGYAGSLEPKHAGEALAKAKKAGSRMLGDADRERAFALHERAVGADDAALGRVVAHLRALGRDRDTALVVTGDVGVDPGARVPFLEDDVLDEAVLAVPLAIRGGPEGKVAQPTTSMDIAPTALAALGLTPLGKTSGVSLWTSIGDDRRALLATAGPRFSARWGGFGLSGFRDHELRLCNLALDPDCVSDVRATHPVAAETLHAVVFDELVGGDEKPAPPTPARTKPEGTEAASLKAWGR